MVLAKHRPAPLALAALSAAALTLAAPATAYGQEPLVADRPGFGDSPSTVGAGRFQVELGYAYWRQSVDFGWGSTARLHWHSLGEVLLRLGLPGDWAEVRVGVQPVARQWAVAGASEADFGVQDLYLGLKLAVAEQSGGMPALAILPFATVPTGSEDFSSEEVLVGLRLLYGWDIGEGVSLGGSTQVGQQVGLPGNVTTSWAQTLSAGFAVGSGQSLYVEGFSQFQDAGEELYLNAGFTRLVTNDLQWDIHFGLGLNDAAADFFVGTGLSARLR